MRRATAIDLTIALRRQRLRRSAGPAGGAQPRRRARQHARPARAPVPGRHASPSPTSRKGFCVTVGHPVSAGRRRARTPIGSGGRMSLAKIRTVVVEDEPVSREPPARAARRGTGHRGRRRVRRRARGGDGHRAARARPRVPRHPAAGDERPRSGARARPGPPSGRRLRHGARRVRAAGVRDPRARLPAEAVQRAALPLGVDLRPRAPGAAAGDLARPPHPGHVADAQAPAHAARRRLVRRRRRVTGDRPSGRSSRAAASTSSRSPTSTGARRPATTSACTSARRRTWSARR